MPKLSIDQVDVAGKRVLMRVDFNVPLDDAGKITDDRRIALALPTIKSVIQRGGKLILMSHLGRPEGNGHEPAFCLKPAADQLRSLLGNVTVHFAEGMPAGDEAARTVSAMQAGEIVLLDNLRFDAREGAGDADFAAKLATFGDIYCNDAFGTAHRNDASMLAVPQAMAGKPRVAGLLLLEELRYLSETITSPKRPFIAILGGAKVSDKLAAIKNLMNKVDAVLIGGAMAYTFLKALEKEVGSSLVQNGMLRKAQEIIDEAAASKTDLLLPTDHVCGKQITNMTPVQVAKDNIPQGWMGLDIGPDTVARYTKTIRDAKTIVWNGPVGVFETPPFDVGTKQLAEAIAGATKSGATSVLGGGDTAAAVEAFGMNGQFTHVSTGGGASLAMLEGKAFETVNILDDAGSA